MKHVLRFSLLAVATFAWIGCAERDAVQEEIGDATMDTAMADMGMDHAGMAGVDTLRAAMTGSAQVPGPGDEDGSGEAQIVLNTEDNEVCYEISVENIAEPAAAHIHSGGADVSGPPVVNFDIAANGLSNCVPADSTIIQDIQMSPSEYYVNVHNEEFGGGAVRGQLGADTM